MYTQHATETRTLPFHPGVSPVDTGRIITRIAKDHGLDEARSAAIFEETLRFLGMAASYPGARFAPSEEVDKGWHTFLLYTKAYRAFCQSLGSKFIDHEPNDLEPARATDLAHCGINCTPSDISEKPPALKGNIDTVRFMEAHGIQFDKALWPKKQTVASCDANNCTATNCYQGDDD